VVAVERYDEVARGAGESALVTAAVAANILANHLGAERGGDFGGAVGGVVIDDDDFIDEVRHGAEDLLDPLLLVEAGDDDGDGLALYMKIGTPSFWIFARLDIMEVMKRLLLLLSCTVALLGRRGTFGVHTVYVLSMSKGLDQYLANRLANDHLFEVVTDPKLADAFFTDRVGESLQSKLEEIFPPPVPEKPVPEKATPDEKPAPAEKPAAKADKDKDSPTNPLLADTVNKLAAPGASNSFSRGKGNVFLVDAKSAPGGLVGIPASQGFERQRIGSHSLRHCKPPQAGSEREVDRFSLTISR